MSIFQVMGLGLKLMGAAQAARAEEQQSKDTAENMITDRIRGEAAAAQVQTQRYAQMFDDIAYNEGALLKNRDYDQSVAAFMDSQKDITFDDLAIMASQANMEKSKQTLQSLLEVERGKNRASAIRISAAADFMSGVHSMQATLVPT
jgi:membrane-bound lytic murein transglycosylase B